eukprot:scaffold26626_cov178-Skeletonema_menzelii.AAC.9
MSAAQDGTDDNFNCCAACGIKELDDIKLKNCTACRLVKYCSVQCQKNHRKQHKKECKKRMAELRDELLFKQPESSHFGDCPICCVPLSMDEDKSSLSSCCCVFICNGCSYANQMKDEHSMNDPQCPFCREPYASSAAEAERNIVKRIQAGNRVAIRQKGLEARMERNYGVSLELLARAANMGDIVAHSELADIYFLGEGVERDEKKAVHHNEEAAIGGHPAARFNLGTLDARSFRHERAVKHFIIAASLGFDKALEKLKEWYGYGSVTKADYAKALRAYQAAIESTKTPQREEAANAPRYF